ncbi:uracil-DNA glycosylase [Helicobacter bizzozeronii]|uniref:uracil-DNA glycosylase n=1 Tax=Helicobacter bizzozeronii TaxID=56877 RepID=UPI000CEF10AA|nr:uracil-DNA glycosylase [Helicobacter bizzozeronii]
MLFHILERLKKSAWHGLLMPIAGTLEFKTLNQNYMQSLRSAQIKRTRVFPLPTELFKAFECTPLECLHTILLGQDPYPGTFKHQGQEYPLAMGLSFSVPKAAPIPKSLQNIYKELSQSLNMVPSSHGDLQAWAAQGVLLLNAILSVEKNRPKSHESLGWESFTNQVLRQLSTLQRPLVFMFLGKVAQEKIKLLSPNPQHLILSAPHPSPLAQSRPPLFLGSGVFYKAQEFLQAQNIPMDWALDPLPRD